MEIESLLREAEEALVKLDSERLVALYSPEFLFEDTASGERITSKDDLKAYFDRLFSLPEVSFTNVSFFGLGERGAGGWTWCGISRSSGRNFEIRGSSLFKLSEKGIKEEILFYDPRAAFE